MLRLTHFSMAASIIVAAVSASTLASAQTVTYPTTDDCGLAPFGFVPPPGGIQFSAPITITQGGTYTGNWASTNSAVAAVTINTAQPVTITNSVIVATGNLIATGNTGVGPLTITKTKGYGLGTSTGMFALIHTGATVDIESNYMEKVWGVRIQGPGAGSPASTVTFKNNMGCNIYDGIYTKAHYLQLMQGIFPGSLISHNVVINVPGQSHIEDTLSIWDAQGTAAAPIRVDQNILNGAYSINPATDAYTGGGILADGSASTTVQGATRYVMITNNYVINSSNYGVAISSGNNNVITGNYSISDGMLADGTPIPTKTIGSYVWNGYTQATNIYFNNYAAGNFLYARAKTSTSTLTLNNSWFPDCVPAATGGTLCVNNVGLNSASDDATALSMVQQYWAKALKAW